MSLTARVFRTNKRKNSTLQAAPGSSYETESIQLKESTDVVYPTFTFNKGMSWNPSALYNYMEVTDLGRRYFINAWRWSNGLWECDCVCDVLGTYKTSILAMEKFVLRSADLSHEDPTIIDDQYPLTGQVSHWSVAQDCNWVRAWTLGWYVVGMVGIHSSTTAGSVNYWVLDTVQMQQLVNYMLSGLGTTDWTLSSWKTEWERIMADPFQYIVSCMYFPVQPPTTSTAQYLSFGYWTTNIQAYQLSGPYTTFRYNINTYYGNNQDAFGYVNANDWPTYWYYPPYSTYVLQFNPFGTIEINGRVAQGKCYIGVEVKVDFISGTAFANFYAHSRTSDPSSFTRFDTFLTTANAQVGVQVQLSQNTSSLIQRVVSTTGTAISGLLGSAVNPASGLNSAANIMSAALEPLNGTFEHTGGTGGIAMDEGILMLHVYRNHVSGMKTEEFGRPSFKNLLLSNCSGFTKCADGANTVAALLQEKQMISDYLEDGFFIE